MPDTHDTDGNVTAWRLQQLEDQIGKLVQATQAATTTLGAQITALSNQIGQGLAALPEHYAPRREAEERHRGINEHFDDLDQRAIALEKALEQRFALRDKALDEREARIKDQMTAIEKRLNDRIDENRKGIQRIESAGWGLAAGLLVSFAGVAFALLKPG